MICPNCNKEIKDDSKFCIFCGANVQSQSNAGNDVQNNAQSVQPQVNTPQYNQPQQSVSAQSQNPQFQPNNFQPAGVNQGVPFQPAMPKKPMNKKLLFGIIGGACALLIIIIVSLVLVANHKTKINLSDYIKVSYDGYDAYGTASAEFDYDKYLDDLMKASSSFKKAYNSDMTCKNLYDSDITWSSIADYYDAVDIDYDLDKTSGLSNGDTVTVNFEYDNDAAAQYKIEYVCESKEYTVEGLKETKKIDPFEGVTVEFSGTSPNVYAKVVNNSKDEVYENIYYDLSKSYDIKIGDTITVTVSNDPEYFVEAYGCVFTSTTKDFKCTAVDQYVSKTADIKEDTLNAMKKQTEDVINAYFAGENKYIGVSDLKFEGTYFLYAKDENGWNWDGNNQIYIIYSGKVKSVEDKKAFDETTVYFPVRFKDIMQYADGTQNVDLNNTSISGETNLEYHYRNVDGYTNKGDMYKELVESQKADYTEEITDGLK